MEEISFKIASSEGEVNAARVIRNQVFVLEQGIPEELDIDSDEDRSVHLLAVGRNLQFIGTGRLTINEDTGILSRISVLNSYRNKGIGKSIILELEKLAREKGVKKLILSPHLHLENFYTGLGYKKIVGHQIAGGYKLISMIKLI